MARLVSEVDGGTNLLRVLDYQTFTQSESSTEVLLLNNQFDVTKLAYHQRKSPDLPLMLIWDFSEDRELVETSLRHWVWPADSWTKPSLVFPILDLSNWIGLVKISILPQTIIAL